MGLPLSLSLHSTRNHELGGDDFIGAADPMSKLYVHVKDP